MANLNKLQLLKKITEAVDESGWNTSYISTVHPFKLNIYKNDIKYSVKIYIWNLTHGGGEKRPSNEYRIQVKIHENFEQESGWITLLLGWWDEVEIFTGFDFRKHLGLPGWSSSIQIKEEALRNAYLNSFAISDKGNQETAIAFRPDFFVEYIQNLIALHDFGQSSDDLKMLESAAGNPELNDEDIQITDQQRKTTAVTIKKKLRDISFRKRVLTAYSNKCAVCGIQLRLIDAAHIIPVEENGTDETSNGLALCALHHRAYDKGLVTVWEDYSVRLNERKVTELRRVNLDGGFDNFKESLRPIILLPPAVSDRPHIEYLKRANEIRRWHG
ncbi:MAG: hypothetical protein BWK80_52260 [Desulfobacteraceae bacterium IS3]|nr:MAG: hypothetical protein BWK80_52260 [Desulfobacteraceae bacterium IS3]